MRNKFTIIIPTRERCDTLYHTIRTCLNQTYKNYEIIVSDNFSKDDTKKIVTSFDDKRITYINTGKRCSMSENFEFALSHTQDGYIMFIGDDDGVLPNSLDYVNDIINSTGVEAVVSNNAYYAWPGTTNRNELCWNAKSGYEVRDSKEWIKKYLTFKMQYTFELPGAYCGFVKREVFDRATKDSFFFRSSSPDTYSALAVAFVTEKYVYSYTTFVVHGSSARSNGAAYLDHKKGEEKKEAISFLKENTIPFHKNIVFTKTFRTSSLEAFLQFSDTFPKLTKEYKINWKLFLQYVLTEAKENTREEIEEAVKKMCQMHGVNFNDIKSFRVNRFSGLSFLEILQKVYNKVASLSFNKISKVDDVTDHGVYNVHDATLLLKFYLLKEYK